MKNIFHFATKKKSLEQEKKEFHSCTKNLDQFFITFCLPSINFDNFSSMEESLTIFEHLESDSAVLKYNKTKFKQILKIFEKNGIKTMERKDLDQRFEIVSSLILTEFEENSDDCEHIFLKSRESPNSSKILRMQTIDLTQKLSFFQELQFLAEEESSVRNIIKIEKIFIDVSENIKNELKFGLLMPSYSANFKSWLFDPQFASVRTSQALHTILVGVLNALEALHSKNIVLCNLNLDNIQINENSDAILSGIGINSDFSSFFSKILSSKDSELSSLHFLAPEITSEAISQRIIDLLFSLNQEIQKSQLFSPKFDIYSFGMILQKIFIKDFSVFPKKLENTFTKFFKLKEDQFFTLELVSRIASFTKDCLSENPELRPSSLQLKSKFSSIQFYENSEDLFMQALDSDDGFNGRPKDYLYAREIFEMLTEKNNRFFHPASFFLNLYNLWGIGGYIKPKKPCKTGLKIAARAAISYFETRAGPELAEVLYPGQDSNGALNMEGDRYSQFALGVIHRFGLLKGKKKDFTLAMKWYSKAAIQHHGAATCCLGFLVDKVQKNEKLAFKLVSVPFFMHSNDLHSLKNK